MSVLTLLLVITTVWIIYHFIGVYRFKQIDKIDLLRKLGYAKSMGLFTMMVGFIGQLIGLSAMLSAIEELTKSGEEIIPNMVFGGIRVTMIVTIYGILIYLFTLLLWFVASIIIERKTDN